MLVLSLGGSLINKNNINLKLLNKLTRFLAHKDFVVVTGGGRIAREYQKALSYFTKNNQDLDFMGIKATELNASLVSRVLKARLIHFTDFINQFKTNKNKFRNLKLVSFGIKPGFTTDYVSIKFARVLNEKTVINMSKIRFVRVNNKSMRHLTWKEYLSLIPKKHSPGLRIPFDVEASKLAMRNKMRVIFAKTVEDLQLFVNKGVIKGTVID